MYFHTQRGTGRTRHHGIIHRKCGELVASAFCRPAVRETPTVSAAQNWHRNNAQSPARDPDCVREDPFWNKYRNLVIGQLQAGQEIDVHLSKYALEVSGCPLGKLVACMGSQQLGVMECLTHIQAEFMLIMSSRWLVLGGRKFHLVALLGKNGLL